MKKFGEGQQPFYAIVDIPEGDAQELTTVTDQALNSLYGELFNLLQAHGINPTTTTSADLKQVARAVWAAANNATLFIDSGNANNKKLTHVKGGKFLYKLTNANDDGFAVEFINNVTNTSSVTISVLDVENSNYKFNNVPLLMNGEQIKAGKLTKGSYVKAYYDQPSNSFKMVSSGNVADLSSEDETLGDNLVTVIQKGGVKRTQHAKNADTISPKDFGAIGDGLYHPLSERFTTLDDAKKTYPTAQSLDDSIDLCALEAFFDHCHDNLVNANITLNAYVNRPLYVGMIRTNEWFKTTVFNGDLTLTNTQATSEIPFLARINVRAATFTGKLTFIGNGDGAVKDRKQLGGLVIGDNGTDGSAGRTHINSVVCNGFKNFGVFISNDAIFPRIDNVHCGRIGVIGRGYTDSTSSHTATITAKTDVDAAYDQYSLLTVTSLPDAKDNDLNILGSMVMFEGDSLPYRVVSVDAANNQIKVYPRLDKNKTYSKLSYIYGTGLGWSGNNSGAGNFGHLQFIVCGIGFWGGSLYGGNINFLSTEYCGVGLTLGKPWEVVIGYNIDNAYFETNTWDYIQQWANNHSPLVNINMAHGLDIAKVDELFSFRVSVWNDSRGQSNLNRSSITLGHRKYEIKDTYYDWVDLSDPQDFINVMNNGFDLTLTYSNIDINDKFNMRAKTLVIAQNYAPWTTPKAITIKVPDGWYLNGVLNGTLTTNPQKFATVLTVVRSAIDNYSTKSLYVYGDSLYKTSGTTTERPSNAPTGFVYIDTSLNKPIYKTNSGWVDSTGAVV